MSGFHTGLLRWYDQYRRDMPWRDTSDPWAIWVSEIMLQQTQVDTVIPYFNRFMASYPSPDALALASEDAVLKHWEGLGYYARARNLQAAATQVVNEYSGAVPDTEQEFMALKGVGPYTAAAVLSIAFGRPMAAVDGNVKRVLARITRNDAPVNGAGSHRIYQPIADSFLNSSRPGDHNQAMMELGARICRPKMPECEKCPVAAYCESHCTGTVNLYPKLKRRKQAPTRHIAVGVIKKGRRMLICKRHPEGLLGGLWEFPGGKVEKGETAAAACIRECREEVNLTVAVEKKLTTVRHAYTHFKIVMDVFICSAVSGRVRLNGPVAYEWVQAEDLPRFAFPKANLKFIPLLKK